MRTLIVSTETFNKMILGFIQSGVTFDAEAIEQGDIKITFTGGY